MHVSHHSDYTLLQDAQLVSYLRADDQHALTEIYNRYWKRMYVFCLRIISDEALSKECVQNIMVDLWERRNTLQIIILEAYLIQAVKYQAAARIREDHLLDIQDHSLRELISSVPDAESIIIGEETGIQVLHVINKLPEACRNVFYLSRFTQRSNKEIADELKISVRTVEKQISKALRFLRTNLSHGLED